MNHLLRALAPISDSGWKMLDDEARERLTPALAARKLIDFSGPHGWEYSATNLGRTAPLAFSPADKRSLYLAGNVLFRTPDRGRTWTACGRARTRTSALRSIFTA